MEEGEENKPKSIAPCLNESVSQTRKESLGQTVVFRFRKLCCRWKQGACLSSAFTWCQQPGT